MITAKLYIRGVREPIELTEEQGRKADKIKKGEGEFASLGDKDTISIGDMWTGEKGDLRYIKFDKVIEPVQETAFSAKEMFDFEREISPYFVKDGDDEFKRFVNLYINDIVNLESKLAWTTRTKDAILAFRKSINPFPDLDTWKKDCKIKREKDEKDENFESRVKDKYNELCTASLVKALKENKDKIQEQAEKITRASIVGVLTQTGRNKYLRELGVINADGDIVQMSDGSIPYSALDHKLRKYEEWKSRIDYAKNKELESYPEATEELVNNMNIKNEEPRDAELF